mgnify:CR=1 FL=1
MSLAINTILWNDLSMGDSQKKIGLIGGTFDPVHNGHLNLAEQAQKKFELDKVIFIPAYRSPHKLGIEPASSEDRLAMLALALNDQPYFSMDKLEVNNGKVSYTIETLGTLKADHPDWNLFLILGADAFQTIDTWKQASRLLEFCSILVGSRPGVELKFLESLKKKLFNNEAGMKNGPSGFEPDKTVIENPEKGNKVNFFQIPLLDISSKDIRKRIKRGEEIKNLLPLNVDHYIMQHRLYRDIPSPIVT